MPQAVAAAHHAVARLQSTNQRDAQRRILNRPEASRQQVRLGVALSFVLVHLTFIDQTLHVGVVDGAADQLRAAEVVDP